MFFLENLLLYFRVWFRHTKCIVVMTKEESTEIVNSMTPGTWVLVEGRDHVSHSEHALFLYKFTSQLPGTDQKN